MRCSSLQHNLSLFIFLRWLPKQCAKEKQEVLPLKTKVKNLVLLLIAGKFSIFCLLVVVVLGPKQPPSPVSGRGGPKKKKQKPNNLDDDPSVEGATATPPPSPPPPEDSDEDCDDDIEAGKETTTDTQAAIADAPPGADARPAAATETATAPTPVVYDTLLGSNDTENAVAAAPIREVAVPVGTPKSTKVSNETEVSEMQMEYILQEPEVCKELEADLKTYVTKSVFPGAKFPLPMDREMLHCRVAARSGICKLPEGVTPEGFGKQFRKVVRKRQKELRANAHASAKWKFDSKFGWRAPFGISWN